jgi:hypothetical protein
MKWKDVFFHFVFFFKVVFFLFPTHIVMNDESDEHIFNHLCVNLHPIFKKIESNLNLDLIKF